MRSRYLLLALLIGLGLALLVSLPSPAGESADKEKIDKLIDQLGSDSFAQRKKAVKELAVLGAPALEALRKAAKSEDAEVRKQAEELVKKIEKEAASAKILAPKRLHLVYKDTPVHEALADFQKKSGYAIHLHDPEGKLKERTITLDTGETTFWHAYELFCEKAGLTEATMQEVMQARWRVPQPGGPPGGAPGAPVPPPVERIKPNGGEPIEKKPIEKKPIEKKPGLAAQAPAAPAAPPAVKPLPAQPARPALPQKPAPGVAAPMMPFMPGMPGQLLLKDGKAKKRPTDDRGAVRVRALPKADMFGAAPEGELILALEATPEPKLQWQNFQSIRIEKALDDQDQTLTQIMPQVPAAPPGVGIGVPGGAPVPLPAARPAVMPVGPWGGINQAIAVQLKKGEKAAKSLKELKGIITAQVLSETKPMITAKLEKKLYKGDEGGSIKILEVKTEGKKTTIRFEFEQPPDTIAAMPQMPGMGMMGGPVAVPVPGVRVLPAAPAPPPPAPAPPAPPAAKAPAPAAREEAAKDEEAKAKAAKEEAAAREARDAKIKEDAIQRQQAQQRAQQRAAQVQVQVQIQGGPGAIAIRGGGAAPAFVGPMNGLSVQDDKGKALPIQMGPMQARVIQGAGGGNTFITTYTLVCEPGKDQGAAAKLVYLGRKRVTVDVPFTLKDVPLP